MVPRSLVPALSVLILALFPAVAQADPWQITSTPKDPVAGEVVAFNATRDNGGGDPASLVWDFGDGSPTATGQNATHTYATAGHYTVTLSTPVGDGTFTPEATSELDVGPAPPPPNNPPSAGFTFSPPGPLVGENVLFTGGSDPDGDPLTYAWDFGDSTTSSEAQPTHAYAAAGPYTVSLTVTDGRGGFASTSQSVAVSPKPEPPPGGGGGGTGGGGTGFDSRGTGGGTAGGGGATGGGTTGGGGTHRTALPRMMRPLPIVRIAGLILGRGARVRLLSLVAPVGVHVVVRCRGRGCPARRLARTTTRRVVRFRRFERLLPAGVTLEFFVRRAGRIGKYSRIRIRAGRPPLRVDRCLVPGRPRPVRCPS